ncbi:hypothetical protein ACFE04_019548 [Oxalis oulophora]
MENNLRIVKECKSKEKKLNSDAREILELGMLADLAIKNVVDKALIVDRVLAEKCREEETGINSFLKKKMLKEIISSQNHDVVCLLEMKLSILSDVSLREIGNEVSLSWREIIADG